MAHAWANPTGCGTETPSHRSRSRRLRLVVALGLTLTCAAAGQSLRLSPPPASPPLSDGGFAAALRTELEGELDALRRTVDRNTQQGEGGVVFAAAMVRYRELAASLLARGEATDPDGHAAAVAGAALAAERANFDALLTVLQQRLDGPVMNRERAVVRAEAAAILRRFAGQPTGVLAELSETEPDERPTAWRGAIAQFIAPLVAATALMTGEEIRDPWIAPPRESMDALAATASMYPRTDEPIATIEELRERVLSARLPSTLQQEFDFMFDLIERGGAFPEFQPAMTRWREMLQEMLNLHAAVSAADWLPRISRAELEEVGVELLKQARERATVDEMQLLRERLAIAQRLITRVNTLRDLQVSAIRLSVVMRVIDDRAPGRQSPDVVRRRAARLERALDRMIRVRALPPVLSHAVQPAMIDALESRYERAEAALLTALHRLATDDAALADPAMSTLLADHRQAAEDLERLRDLDAWAGAIGMIRPGGGEAFARFTQRLLDWLVDPLRRADAVPLIDQFSLERRLFLTLPFEGTLRSGETTTIPGSRARRDALLAEIERQREAWARAWTEGVGHAAASERLMMLRRLLLAMQDAHATGVDRSAPMLRRLNRWPCWQMPPAMLERMTRDLIARASATVPTVLREEPATLARELDQLERVTAVARLAGRLLTVLSDELAAQPMGLTGVLNALVHLPAADGWPGAYRDRFVEISRYVLEADHALERDRPSAADDALRYANALAADLLLELGDHPDPPPTLHGFNDG